MARRRKLTTRRSNILECDGQEYRIQKAKDEGTLELDLRFLGLHHLSESVGQLTHLESLDVANNNLRSLPESLGNLRQLQSLSILVNRIESLPEWLGRLTHLRNLAVYSNVLRLLPECLGRLKQLRRLDAAANQLTSLPSALGKLSQLQNLNLAGNELRSLPESLGRLTQLRNLNLANNHLTSLPESLGQLACLEKLDVTNNDLSSLPESLSQLTALTELHLHGNEMLGLPAEVLGDRRYGEPAEPGAILDFYFRTRRGRRPLNEVKLILVGRGGVGKTCLIKRLMHNTFDEHEPETPGIEIQPWEVTLSAGDKVRLHVWDFGGQEILHATHQFFLTERTVYLLVLSGREGNPTQDAEYWLQLIRSFGGDSRVIVALNKVLQHPFDVNRGLLLEKYPFIADFVKTDCNVPDGSDAPGVSSLKELVLRATDQMGHRKKDFPADWFAIKERLAGMKENFVTWERYQEIYRELGETDLLAQRNLAHFLHILGIALNYRDDPRLKETHVLNPRWVTEGIYTLLRGGQKAGNQGVLARDDLASLLDIRHYPPSHYDFLLRLMEKFQLCFELRKDSGKYLVPELLGENQPDIRELLDAAGLGFRYQFEVLPEGLLPRFIVQTHAHSEPNPEWRWRTGVVLERDDCKAVVRADARERRVDIHIIGAESQRRGVLAIIREKFDEQHRDLKGLAVDERVPIFGEPGVTVSYQHLLTLEEENEEWCRSEGSKSKLNVTELLNGIESPQLRGFKRSEREASRKSERHGAQADRFDVFLSHNSKDKPGVSELKKQLTMLGLRVWYDESELQPGVSWQDLLEIGIRTSESVAVLIGKDGLGPWENEEMQGALTLAVNDKRPIIPTLLPGARNKPELPIFLRNRTWVDLRNGFTKDGLTKLVWGITGQKPEA